MKTKALKQLFLDSGFDLVGIAKPDFSKLKEKLTGNNNNPLIKGSVADRIRFDSVLDGAKTAIVVGLTYTKESNVVDRNKLHFGNSSWGIDYHQVLKEKLELVCLQIKSLIPDFEYEICVDTSVLDDRFLAYSAGIGIYGKNSLLINPDLGSYFFIGSVICNLDLNADSPLTSSCKGCNLCIKACPTGALNESNYLDYKKCCSYITQTKEELNEDQLSSLSTCIFGCDICAKVCPYNKDKNHVHNKEFLPSGIEVLSGEINLTNKEFKEQFGHLSGAFVGKKVLNRNIKYIKDKYNIV